LSNAPHKQKYRATRGDVNKYTFACEEININIKTSTLYRCTV